MMEVILMKLLIQMPISINSFEFLRTEKVSLISLSLKIQFKIISLFSKCSFIVPTPINFPSPVFIV